MKKLMTDTVILLGMLALTGSTILIGPATAQNSQNQLVVVKYLTRMVKVYDENLKLVLELPAEQLPSPGAPVGAARAGKIPVFSAEGKGYWIARSSVMLNNGKPLVLPPCRDGQYAKPGDQVRAGEMGLGEGRLCQRNVK